MKRLMKRLFFYMLCAALVGCTSVNDDDLVYLRSNNPVLKLKVLGKISQGSSPFDWAYSFLGGQKEEMAIEIMVSLLTSGKESKEIEAEILSALGALSEKSDVPIMPIIEKIEDDDPRVHGEAVKAVAKAKAKEAFPILAKYLGKENKDKYAVIWALGEIGDDRAVSPLSELLLDKDENVRFNARKALEKIEVSLNEKEQPDQKTSGTIVWLAKAFNKGYQKAMICVFRKLEGFLTG